MTISTMMRMRTTAPAPMYMGRGYLRLTCGYASIMPKNESPQSDQTDNNNDDNTKPSHIDSGETGDVRGKISDPVQAPGPSMAGDRPDGTNDNQAATADNDNAE